MIAKILIPGALVLATFASAAGYATYNSLTANSGTQASSEGGCCSQGGCPLSAQATACHATSEGNAAVCCGNSSEACCDNDPECCGVGQACCEAGLPCCDAATASNQPVGDKTAANQPAEELQATAAN